MSKQLDDRNRRLDRVVGGHKAGALLPTSDFVGMDDRGRSDVEDNRVVTGTIKTTNRVGEYRRASQERLNSYTQPMNAGKDT